MTPVFLDANVPIYAVGRPHRLQQPSRAVLSLMRATPGAFFTDAEVLQEILHRYIAIRRGLEGCQLVNNLAETMAGRIEPLHASDVETAAALFPRYPHLDARDLVHLAVMNRVGSRHIVTADRAFDAIDGIDRLDPARVDEWAPLVTGSANP